MKRRTFLLGAGGLLLPLRPALAQFGMPADLGVTGTVATPPSTFNPSNKGASVALSNGNLTAARSSGTGNNSVTGTLSRATGKWYFEVKVDSKVTEILVGVGLSTINLASFLGSDVKGWGYDSTDGNIYNNGVVVLGPFSLYTTNDVIGVAIDIGAGKLWVAKNNSWQNSGDPAAGTNPVATGVTGTLFPAATVSNTTDIVTARFGSGNSFSPPSGFSLWG